MRVSEIMSSDPITCAPTDQLSTAVWRMWQTDCGFLPVTVDGVVVGVITDRDAAVSLRLRGCRPDEVLVSEAMQGHLGVIACKPDDPVKAALDLMRDHQLRRLPVVADDGQLVGVLSLTDLALAAGPTAAVPERPTFRRVAETPHGACTHPVSARAA